MTFLHNNLQTRFRIWCMVVRGGSSRVLILLPQKYRRSPRLGSTGSVYLKRPTAALVWT